MIEASAVVLGPTRIDPSAYIGHFAVVGAPSTGRPFGRPHPVECNEETRHWRESRGTVVCGGATISEHARVGDGTTVGQRAFLGSGVYLGHDVVVDADVEIYFRAQVHNRVHIGPEAWIAGFVCNDVKIGARAVIFGALVHRFVDAVRGEPETSPVVESDAFIGMGATVVGDVRVGEHAYIAAGSVLTHDAEPGRLYVGSPARDHGEAPKAFRNRAARREGRQFSLGS